jgi:hypothetical protein
MALSRGDSACVLPGLTGVTDAAVDLANRVTRLPGPVASPAATVIAAEGITDLRATEHTREADREISQILLLLDLFAGWIGAGWLGI